HCISVLNETKNGRVFSKNKEIGLYRKVNEVKKGAYTGARTRITHVVTHQSKINTA
ncbi:hypothetical protein L9F63_015873, partial [Diploptera punctata]